MPSLADILKAEADLASAFVIVLEEEQEVLKTGNPDALPSLAERKSTLAGQLNPQSAARNRLLASEGLPGDRPGILRILECRLLHRPRSLQPGHHHQRVAPGLVQIQHQHPGNGHFR